MRLTVLVSVVALGCTVPPQREVGGGVDEAADGEAADNGGGEADPNPDEVGGEADPDPGGEADPDPDPGGEADPDPGGEEGGGEGGEEDPDPGGEEGGEADPDPLPTGASIVVDPRRLDLGDVVRGARSEIGEIAVTNDGDEASAALVFELEGSDGFSVEAAPSGGDCLVDGVLEAGAVCQIGVAFEPESGGPALAALSIGDQVVLITAQGLGFGAALLTAGAVADHDFGQVDDTATQGFVLSNAGELPTPPIRALVTGEGFELGADSCSEVALEAGQDCTIDVVFTPDAPGEFEGALRVLGGELAEIALRGLGPDGPAGNGPAVLGADREVVDFEDRVVGEGPLGASLRITNSGESAAEGLLWGVEGDEDFSAAPHREDGCEQGGALLAGSSCVLAVRFDPVGFGRRRAVVVISGEGLRPIAVNLMGVGLDEIVGEPGLGRLEVAQPEGGGVLDFGIVDEPDRRTVLMRNAGGGPTGNLSTRLTGDPAISVRAGDDGCVGRTLGGGDSCRIDVTFSPQANGGVEATLTVTSPGQDDELDVVSVDILGAGQGFDPAVLELDPVRHDYGEIDVGEESDDEFFTLRNTGDLSALALRIALGGDHPGDFRLADVPNGCVEGVDLPGGSACLLGARFAPQAGNARGAQLAVAADGVQEPTIATLVGAGHSLLNGDLGGIPFCFERRNSAGHRVGVFNSRNGQNPEQRHNGHADWRSFCEANGWDDHNRGAGNSNNTCDVLENDYVNLNHLNGGGNWDENDYAPNRPPGNGHIFHTCIIEVGDVD